MKKIVPPTQLILPPPQPLTQFIVSSPTGAGGERRRVEDIFETVKASTVGKIWTFLSSCNFVKLHSLCNNLNATQQSKNKKDIIPRILQKIRDCTDKSSAWSDCPQDSISETCLAIVEYNSWLKRTWDATVWKSAPKIANQIAADINDDTEAAKKLTFGEFGRLILLLSQEDDCKAALLNIGKELSRHELARKVSRDAFCDRVIAPKFNKASTSPFFLSLLNMAISSFIRFLTYCELGMIWRGSTRVFLHHFASSRALVSFWTECPDELSKLLRSYRIYWQSIGSRS